MYSILLVGDICRGKRETLLFSIQIGGKRHLPSSSLQRACVGQNLRAHRAVVINLSTVAPSASSSLLRQHVGAELGEWLVEMGRFDHAAVKRLVLCVLLPVYRSGGYCRRRLCSMCQQARIKIRKDSRLAASWCFRNDYV